MNGRLWDEEWQDRVAPWVLGLAMAIATGLLIWQERGLTFFVDEWTFGYLARPGLALAEIAEPDNGHFTAIPILLTKASLELFGAGTTLPLRLVAMGAHLTVVLVLFLFLRRHLGSLLALPPAILVLFLGVSSDVFVGSHALPIQLAAAFGLCAWLALDSRTRAGDVLATALLCAGVLCNGFVLPLIVGAAAIVLLQSQPRWSRLWVVAAPVGVYALWWLGYGHDANSGFKLDNVAGLPSFIFDSLAATLAAITGLFAAPGAHNLSFQLGPGQALAGAVLVGLLAVAVARDYRPPRAALPALLALLAAWVATGLVAGERQPEAGRYIYTSVVLLLIAAAPAIAAIPGRSRQMAVVLAGICALGLLPNLRELHYSSAYFRAQSSLDRAVLGAVELVGAQAPGHIGVESPESAVANSVLDMGGTVDTYRESRERYGTPAYSLEQVEASDAGSREAADRFIARALSLAVLPAEAPPGSLPVDLPVSGEQGKVQYRRGCFVFEPLAEGARLTMSLPRGGIWIEPRQGPAVPVELRRFGDSFAIEPGTAGGGRASVLGIPPGPSARDWEARLSPQQAIVVCGL